MPRFSLDTQLLQGIADDIDEPASTLAALSQKLEIARAEVGLSLNSPATIDRSISSVSQHMFASSKALSSYATALKSIAEEYGQAETGIASSLTAVLNGARPAGQKNGVPSAAMPTSAGQDNDVFGPSNTYSYEAQDGSTLVFHEGDPKRPRWEAYKDYDNYYPYDPNEKPTVKDYVAWQAWSLAPLYQLFKDVPDGMKAYEHYRSGSGEDLEVDYARAYKEDENIRVQVDSVVSDTNQAVMQMIKAGKQPPFSITSELTPMTVNPSTENWQKTIGRHMVWVSSDVIQGPDGSVVIKTTVHELDRYNFNKGDSDIATGFKDADNGRFETLGWAKSFNTYGEVSFETKVAGDLAQGEPSLTSDPGRTPSRAKMPDRSQRDDRTAARRGGR